MYNFEIRNTSTLGVIYIVDFEIIHFQKVTKLLRANKLKFELTIASDFFRIELLDKDISFSDVMKLIEFVR